MVLVIAISNATYYKKNLVTQKTTLVLFTLLKSNSNLTKEEAFLTVLLSFLLHLTEIFLHHGSIRSEIYKK